MRVKEVVARYIFKGKRAEILINWEKYNEWKKGNIEDVREVVIGDSLFENISKANRLSQEDIKVMFGDKSFEEICKEILEKGEIQLTEEQRKEMQEQKRKRIVHFIVANAIDPRTNTPLTPAHVENALENAKFKVNALEPVEKQIEKALKALKPIIPIKIERKRYLIKIPLELSARTRSAISKIVEFKVEDWSSNYYICEVEIPAGLMNELFGLLNKYTKGNVYIEEKR